MATFDELVSEFLTSEKVASHAPRWRSANQADYSQAYMRVHVPGSLRLRGRVIVTAHKLREPPKYGFSLVFRNERLLALDVNPARFHRNLLAPAKIGGTHWQRWPKMEAEADNRVRPFNHWLHEFLVTANVGCRFRVLSPPRGIQLELSKW
ncbi:hypothetical protein ACVI1L_006792 [Bradyrhizobium sp. USDA 4516]